MIILADEAIHITPELLALGRKIKTVSGRNMGSVGLDGVEALLIRTITKCNKQLLENSSVRFVGSATAGTDHMDVNWLAYQGIDFAAAPGVNAGAVCDYVLAALASTDRLASICRGASIGVVGAGHVGQTLSRRLLAMGARVLVYDPYVDVSHLPIEMASLEDTLSQPIVTLHCALHDRDPHATFSLLTPTLAERIPDGGLLINTSRGEIVSSDVLYSLARRGVSLCLDVWPKEPEIDLTLLEVTTIATPHIAGYSAYAKQEATNSLIPKMINALNLVLEDYEKKTLTNRQIKPNHRITLSNSDQKSPDQQLLQVLRSVVDIESIDLFFRAAIKNSVGASRCRVFDQCRETYKLREELQLTTIDASSLDSTSVDFLRAAGVHDVFKMEKEGANGCG